MEAYDTRLGGDAASGNVAIWVLQLDLELHLMLLRWVFMSLRMGTTCKYCLVGVKHNGNYTLLVIARAPANVVFLVPLCLESFHFQVQKVHSPNLFK